MATRKTRRKASAKQLAALARGRAKMAARRARKSAPAKPKRRRSAKRRSSLSQGRHRPVVIKRKSRLYRPRRSTIPAHASFANPFLGGLTVMGNPRRRKSSHKSKRRSHRRSRSMSLYSNPAMSGVLAAPKALFKKDFVTEAASVAAGFVLPNIVMARLPASFRNATWKGYASKIAVVAVLAGASNMVSKRVSKAILLGGGVSLLLDVYADFIAPAISGLAPKMSGVDAFYGNHPSGMGAYYGDGLSDNGMSGDNAVETWGTANMVEAWG